MGSAKFQVLTAAAFMLLRLTMVGHRQLVPTRFAGVSPSLVQRLPLPCERRASEHSVVSLEDSPGSDPLPTGHAPQVGEQMLGSRRFQ